MDTNHATPIDESAAFDAHIQASKQRQARTKLNQTKNDDECNCY